MDVTAGEVTLTTVFAGVDHSGSGATLADAVQNWSSGIRYVAGRWDKFAATTAKASPVEQQRAAAFMSFVSAASGPTEMAALLRAAFGLAALIPPAA